MTSCLTNDHVAPKAKMSHASDPFHGQIPFQGTAQTAAAPAAATIAGQPAVDPFYRKRKSTKRNPQAKVHEGRPEDMRTYWRLRRDSLFVCVVIDDDVRVAAADRCVLFEPEPRV